MPLRFGFELSPYTTCSGLDLSHAPILVVLCRNLVRLDPNGMILYTMYVMVKEAQRYFPTELQKIVRLVYIVLVVEVVVG